MPTFGDYMSVEFMCNILVFDIWIYPANYWRIYVSWGVSALGPNCPGPSCPGPNCPGPDCPGPNLPRTDDEDEDIFGPRCSHVIHPDWAPPSESHLIFTNAALEHSF